MDIRLFLEKAAGRMDLPADVAAGLPAMELTGFSMLTVEHHKGIREYSQSTVELDVGIGYLRVEGKDLYIRLMNSDLLAISGEIQTLQLKRRGQA